MPTMADLGAHKGGIESMRLQKAALPKDPQHVVKKTNKLAETQQQETSSLGGTASVKQQGGRIGGMTGGGARLGSHTAERAGVSKQPARKQLTAARHKSHEMSVPDLLAQLKQVTEDKEKENDGVTGARPKFFLTFRLLLSLC